MAASCFVADHESAFRATSNERARDRQAELRQRKLGNGGNMRVGSMALHGIRYAVASAVTAASIAGQQGAPKPAVPVDPIPAIVEAFREHEVVALGDAHGNEQARMFLRSLIRDARFAAAVNDIVIEFGNARYQSVVDRYVNGGDVPPDSLAQVWRNTTVANEIPVDEEFFSIVRPVNATRCRTWTCPTGACSRSSACSSARRR
jgi:hypothetical protein